MTLPQPYSLPVAPSLPGLEDGPPVGLGALVARMEAQEIPLPLTRVQVRASVLGPVARVVVEQTFRNPLTVPCEAVHLFPLPMDGAVTEVELRAGEIVVRAECRERQEAQATYDAAVQAGHRAALLTQERDDVHTLRVANLPPGTEVSVRIVVIQRLVAQDGALTWRFPTVIPPRYLPGDPVGHEGPGVLPDTTSAPDASRLQPPLLLEGGTALDLEVFVAGPVAHLRSSLHAVALDLEDGGVRVAPSVKAVCDRDFVLSFRAGSGDQLVTRAWSDGQHTLALVAPPLSAAAPVLPRDAVFVVDVSGSMQGAKLAAAKLALRTALRGLNPGDRFQVIAFSSQWAAFAPDLQAYDDGSLARAERWVERLQANGGTEMLEPLKAALAGETPEGRVRTVLFVTDGQAWNEAELVAMVGHRRKAGRVFTLGIDTAPNSPLLERLARVGGGTCTLVGPRDDLEATIARLEARFGSPVAHDVTAKGGIAARDDGRTIFAGEPVAILIEGAPEPLVVSGRTAAGPFSAEVTPERTQVPLGALWARERVASLEDRMTLRPHEEEALRPAILEVALAHGIACRFTAFVAVDTSVTVEGERATLLQPHALPHEWNADAFGGPVASGMMPPGVPMAAAPMASPKMDAMPMDARMRSAPVGSVAGARKRSAPARRGGVLRSVADTVGSLFSRDASAGVDESFEAEEVMAAPPAPRSAREAERAAPSAAPDTGDLARAQRADGSFDGDARATAAAVLAFVLDGNTRVSGLRRRAVAKAAAWLDAHRGERVVDAVLALLEAVEAGAEIPGDLSTFAELAGVGPAAPLLAGNLSTRG